MKLGLDIDGIVADMATDLIAKTNEHFGTDFNVDSLTHHNLFRIDYTGDGAKNQEIAKFMSTEVVHNKDTLYNLKPHEDALEALRALRKGGHRFYFITARRSDEYEVTVNWFRRNNIPFDRIYMAPSVKGDSRKGLLGRSLNLDFYIDDDYRHIESMYRYKNRWRKGLGILTRPWNKGTPIDGNICVRFDDWNELIRHLGIHNR